MYTSECFNCKKYSPGAFSENECDYKAYKAGWVTGLHARKKQRACPDCRFLLKNAKPVRVKGLSTKKLSLEITNKADKNNGLHFIFRTPEGNDEIPIIGDENHLCIQALRLFSDKVAGKSITDFHFYAQHGDSWLHITFIENTQNKRNYWPEFEYGDALGTPVIETMNNDANLKELLAY